MYSVYADGVCIYNDAFALDNMKLANPKLTLEDNAAGSFVMTVPPSNLGYSTIIRMVTDIAVHKDGKESSPSALLLWWMKIFRLITPTMKRPSRS